MSEEKKVLGVWIDVELKNKFKVHCAKKNISMESVITEAIKQELKNK